VSGYGGLLITSCEINKEAVTVLYGHLSLASITKKLGESVQVGEQVATLGQGFSRETDGERKHLHLGFIVARRRCSRVMWRRSNN
jgi:septal ring factor EnvC (AmiA/AmiB activator)